MGFDFKKVFSSVKKVTPALASKVVGIDFGSSSVKVVEVEKVEGILSLSTYGELQLGPYGQLGMGNAVKLPLQKRIEALVDVLRESKVTAQTSILSLPLSDSFVTIIPLQAKGDEDITPRVHVEARKYIPVPLSDVALEWSELSQEEKGSNLTREVLLVAILNEALRDMNALGESVSMSSRRSELEIFSTLRAVTKESDAAVAIIDIGARTSKLYIAEGGFLQRIHRVQTGGSYVTQALATQKGISFEDAENMKRSVSSQSQDGQVIKKIMSSVFERSFQEFKRVLQQHEMRTHKPVSRIALTGGAVLHADFVVLARYCFEREVEITNPFTKIGYPAFMEDTLASIAPIFTVALGAALQSFEQ
jgi:type IV pilus assembly protein PilM